MKKIPITYYLTANATDEAKALVEEYGLVPHSYQELFRYLNTIFKKYPEEAYKQFGLIHPDRQMILDSIEKPVEEKKSGADGGFSCEKTSGADGSSFNFDLKKQLPYILAGAGVLTGLIILAKSI